MALEAAIRKLCTPAVFSRAKRLAANGDMLHRRKCVYEGEETVLDARVESSSSWEGPRRPQVVVDEHADGITFFECDCAGSRGSDRPCKHVAALVLDFCARPERYEGYDSAGHVRTSRVLVRLMEQARQAEAPAIGTATESRPETVRLEPTIAYEAGFSVRFRLEGEHGGYVMRSISDFVGACEAGAYLSYGRSLGFVHEPEAFVPGSREIAEFIVRAVRNRRAYAFDRAIGAGPLGTNGAPQREMHLSSVELWDLLGMLDGCVVAFEDRGTSHGDDRAVRELRVVSGDPTLSFDLATAASDSYELVRRGGARVVAAGRRAVAWDEHALYCCSEGFSANAVPLAGLFGAGADRLALAQQDAAAFAATLLPRLERIGSVKVPRELDELRPEPCELQFYLDRASEGVTCEAYAAYGNERVPLVSLEASPREVVRDVQAEARGRTLVRRYFPRDESGALLIRNADDQAMAAFAFEGVAELQRVGTVYATDAFDRLKSKVRPKPRAELVVRSNLLDLRLSADGLAPEELAELLESYRLRKRYHVLRDGSFVDMRTAELDEVAALMDELGVTERELAGGEATMPAYRALLLDADVEPEWRDVSLDRYLDGITRRESRAYEPPQSLAQVLRPYQREGFAWMSELVDRGLAGVLADEMGLGKSLQLITLLLARRDEARLVGPSLVVCPASLVYNWAQEFAKFAPSLAVQVVSGTAEERRALRERSCDVLVTSYDLLRRDVEDYARTHLWMVALDEAQYIKNEGTQAARAVKRLACDHRIALTGTPVENRLSELWSIFDFLMPGLLGSHEAFRERFERPIAEEGDRERSRRLGRALGPFVLRRTKREVLGDLPEKLEQVVYARMGTEQRSLYDAQVLELRKRLLAGDPGDGTSSPGGERMQVLAALMRLRQTCCDPRLVFEDYEGPSAKVETILTLVDRVSDAGERVLLFSQFTSFLRILEERLDERGVSHVSLTGSTPKRRRIELVDEFNQGSTCVFLISLKAGGTGLNLTGASVVIHADPWWNAAAQDQATDRAHRMGQTRDVMVYKVICADTIEERIQDLQRRKAQLASQVVGVAATGSLAGMSPAELADLLG